MIPNNLGDKTAGQKKRRNMNPLMVVYRTLGSPLNLLVAVWDMSENMAMSSTGILGTLVRMASQNIVTWFNRRFQLRLSMSVGSLPWGRRNLDGSTSQDSLEA